MLWFDTNWEQEFATFPTPRESYFLFNIRRPWNLVTKPSAQGYRLPERVSVGIE